MPQRIASRDGRFRGFGIDPINFTVTADALSLLKRTLASDATYSVADNRIVSRGTA
jgi:hypothetical protein